MMSFHGSYEKKEEALLALEKYSRLVEYSRPSRLTDPNSLRVFAIIFDQNRETKTTLGWYSKATGIPVWMLQTVISLFGMLSKEHALGFIRRWVKWIPVGVNLNPVLSRMFRLYCRDQLQGLSLRSSWPDVLEKQMIKLLRMVHAWHDMVEEDITPGEDWYQISFELKEDITFTRWVWAQTRESATYSRSTAELAFQNMFFLVSQVEDPLEVSNFDAPIFSGVKVPHGEDGRPLYFSGLLTQVLRETNDGIKDERKTGFLRQGECETWGG